MPPVTGSHSVTLSAGTSAYFGYGWVDFTPPGGTTAGCITTTKVESAPPGDLSPLTVAVQLSAVCPGGAPSMTAVASAKAFSAVSSPASP
jgi:hypothetical protein